MTSHVSASANTQRGPRQVYSILVGVDYSTASERALRRALEIANSQPNAELHIVHVVSTLDAPPPGSIAGSEDIDEFSSNPHAHQQLQSYVAVNVGAFERLRNGSPRKPLKVISHLRAHAPSQEIAQLAADLEVDLVVVGMCGRSSIARLLLGSVAESVTRLAPCPVLVYRPKGLPPEYPRIEPPCPACLDARIASEAREYWCPQHREKHGQRHMYRDANRVSQDTCLPLVIRE